MDQAFVTGVVVDERATQHDAEVLAQDRHDAVEVREVVEIDDDGCALGLEPDLAIVDARVVQHEVEAHRRVRSDLDAELRP